MHEQLMKIKNKWVYINDRSGYMEELWLGSDDIWQCGFYHFTASQVSHIVFSGKDIIVMLSSV